MPSRTNHEVVHVIPGRLVVVFANKSPVFVFQGVLGRGRGMLTLTQRVHGPGVLYTAAYRLQ